MKGAKTNKAAEAAKYEVKVTRAKEFDGGAVSFDMLVNGITIYGCWYREYEKDGKESCFLSFPQRKGNDEKYYNYCYFPIDELLKADIIAQLQELV